MPSAVSPCMLPTPPPPPVSACSFNKRWLDDHIEASKTYLGGKPLVLQEYNMPASSLSLRLEYYDYVRHRCRLGPLPSPVCLVSQ